MILIAGGTGRLGLQLTQRLRARNIPVRVLTRSPERARPLQPLGVDVVIGDIRRPADVDAAMQGVRTVVSAVHGFVGFGNVSPQTIDRDGNVALVDAAARAGASVVLMSVVGVSSTSPMVLFRMKDVAEHYLRASPVPWAIVRSTPFTELWIDLLESSAGRSGRPRIFGRGRMPIEFVSVHDVAQGLDIVLQNDRLADTTVEIGNPERVTFEQLADLIQQAAGRTGRARHVPRPALAAMATLVAGVKPELARQARAALEMDRTSLPEADTSFRMAHPEIPVTPVAEVVTRLFSPSTA